MEGAQTIFTPKFRPVYHLIKTPSNAANLNAAQAPGWIITESVTAGCPRLIDNMAHKAAEASRDTTESPELWMLSPHVAPPTKGSASKQARMRWTVVGCTRVSESDVQMCWI